MCVYISIDIDMVCIRIYVYGVSVHKYMCTCTYIDAVLFSYSETYQVYVHFTLAIHISESDLSDSQTCTYMCAPGTCTERLMNIYA